LAEKKKTTSKKNIAKVKAKTQKPKSAVKSKTTAKKSKKVTNKKVVSKPKAKSTTKKSVAKKVTKTSNKKVVSKKTVKSSTKKIVKKNKNEIKKIEEYEIEESAKERGDYPMTVVDHLDEFRSKIIVSLLAVIIFSAVGFYFSDYLLMIINKPFLDTGQKLNIFTLTGGFIIRIKSAVTIGLILSMPIIVWQIWRYIKPALAKEDRTFSRIALLASLILFFGGVTFVFFVLLPFAIKMLLKFIPPENLSTIGANDYFSFILKFSLAMGILFELPIIVMILTRIKLVTPVLLIQKRKYAIVIIWVISAFITPQDIFSQILVAIPLMILYEISIMLSKLMIKRANKRELKNNEV